MQYAKIGLKRRIYLPPEPSFGRDRRCLGSYSNTVESRAWGWSESRGGSQRRCQQTSYRDRTHSHTHQSLCMPVAHSLLWPQKSCTAIPHPHHPIGGFPTRIFSRTTRWRESTFQMATPRTRAPLHGEIKIETRYKHITQNIQKKTLLKKVPRAPSRMRAKARKASRRLIFDRRRSDQLGKAKRYVLERKRWNVCLLVWGLWRASRGGDGVYIGNGNAACGKHLSLTLNVVAGNIWRWGNISEGRGKALVFAAYRQFMPLFCFVVVHYILDALSLLVCTAGSSSLLVCKSEFNDVVWWYIPPARLRWNCHGWKSNIA